jgi:uncharacterized membrane protein
MRRALVLACLVATACQPAQQMLGGVDLKAPMRALGTEPFWSLAISPERIVFTGEGRPDFETPNPGARIEGELAVFSAHAPSGLPLTIRLTPGKCSDGLSDWVYPLAVEVTLGPETLKGCATSQTQDSRIYDGATLP